MSDHSGLVKRWWFVIHAPENVLLDMDVAWEQLHLQTGWKLEPCFRLSQLISESTANNIPQQQCVESTGSTEESNCSAVLHEHNICSSDEHASTQAPACATPFLEN